MLKLVLTIIYSLCFYTVLSSAFIAIYIVSIAMKNARYVAELMVAALFRTPMTSFVSPLSDRKLNHGGDVSFPAG